VVSADCYVYHENAATHIRTQEVAVVGKCRWNRHHRTRLSVRDHYLRVFSLHRLALMHPNMFLEGFDFPSLSVLIRNSIQLA
jgi:hypothetical protein